MFLFDVTKQFLIYQNKLLHYTDTIFLKCGDLVATHIGSIRWRDVNSLHYYYEICRVPLVFWWVLEWIRVHCHHRPSRYTDLRTCCLDKFVVQRESCKCVASVCDELQKEVLTRRHDVDVLVSAIWPQQFSRDASPIVYIQVIVITATVMHREKYSIFIHNDGDFKILIPYRWNKGETIGFLPVCQSVRQSTRSVHLFFRIFLSRLLGYWLDIWYMHLSLYDTDQVRHLLRLTFFYMSHCPLL